MRRFVWFVLFALLLCLSLPLVSCGGGDDDDDDDDDDDTGDDDDDDDDTGEWFDDDPSPHDYIIIAADEQLELAACELKRLRHEEGLSVLSTNLAKMGAEKAEGEALMLAVRDFIFSEYVESIPQYVLLVGSHDRIPMCIAYLDPADHSLDGDYTTLTDFFYADMDSAWDSDGDGFYGEYEDDMMDFTAELLIGRIPLDEAGKVGDVADRIVGFTGNGAAWKNDVMLAAGTIMFEGDASILMELIRTQTLVPAGYNVTTAYADTNIHQPDIVLTNQAFVDYWIQHDLGFVMWACHGSSTAAYTGPSDPIFIRVTDLDDLAGTAPSVVFSSACHNADAFEYSLGHAFIDQLAPAFVGSTAVTHPGDIGEGSLTFFITIEEFFVDGRSLGVSFKDGIDYYMENYFLQFGYDPQLYLRNIYGFHIYGDPALTYRP